MKFQVIAAITRRPGVPEDWFETCLEDMSVAMFLPISARIGVTIRSTQETAYRPLHASPRSGPLIRRQGDPSRGATERCLNISLFGIGLLAPMAMKAAITVGNTRCLHGGQGVTNVLEHSRLPILVDDIVSLGNGTTPELAARVAQMDFPLAPARLGRNV
jgi:hypothetical protein